MIIVGAGPAGVRAAERLVRAGRRPLIVDEATAAGGQIYRRQPANFRRKAGELYGFEAGKAEAVHRAFAALRSEIDYRPETLAWAVYDEMLQLVSPRGQDAVPFDALILTICAPPRLVTPGSGLDETGRH